MSAMPMNDAVKAKHKLRPTDNSSKLNGATGTVHSLQTKSSGRPKGGGGNPKLDGVVGTIRRLQTKSNGRPKGGGGSPKLHEAIETVRSLQALGNGRPKGGGGSPKIAAAYNSFGNDCIRLAAQQSALLDTAVVIYSRAIEYDPDDPGLMVNLAITNLVKGDTLAVNNLFVMAFVLCEEKFDRLYSLMGLKHAQIDYPPEHPLHGAESILRATIANSLARAGVKAGAASIMPEEAKEFLYVKPIDIGEKQS